MGNNNGMNCPRCGMLLYPDGSCPACRKALPSANAAGRVFRDPKRLTTWLRWLLVGVASVHIFYGVCAILRALMLHAFVDGLPSASMLALATRATELREGAVGNVLSALYFGAVLVFAAWTYRMNSNTHALGGSNLRFTPAWSVGWYFVPIANLWKPYQVVRELWAASANPAGWHAERTSKLLSWWWASWLGCALSPLVAFAYLVGMSVQEDAFGHFTVLEIFGVISAAFGLAAAVFAYLVVARIGSFQEQAADRSLSAVFA